MSGDDVDAPGAVLARTREARGISQREVSDVLNLPMQVLEALETGDRSRLPALVFVRGYIRAYAKFLSLEPGPLISAFSTELTDAEPAEDTDQGHRVALPAIEPRHLALAGLGAGVLAVVLLAVWLFSGDDPDTQPVLETQVTRDEPDVPTRLPPLPSRDETDAEDQNDQIELDVAEEVVGTYTPESPESLESPEEVGLTDVRSATGPGQEAPVFQAATVATADARRLTPAGDDRLLMEFTEECWVEIKTTAGTTLFADLGRAGQSLEFVGQGPFRILLGYAPGVILRYNFESVALSPHTRNNVASLVLGQ